MHKEYRDQGLEILAFPCNQFGKQEAGSPEEIQKFVQDEYGAEFPLLEKINVNNVDISKGGAVKKMVKDKFVTPVESAQDNVHPIY